MASFVDAAGVAHSEFSESPRIVCLVPSITELLCTLGLADALVGRTGFCIHPRERLRSVVKVGGTKEVDLEAIRALSPSHVIVNIDENLRETADSLRAFVPHVIVTHPLDPMDNLPLYRLLGGIFNRRQEAEVLCQDFERARLAVQRSRPAQRVLYLIWRDPWMTVARDTYISRMLSVFNWQTWQARSVDRYPVLALEECRGEIDRILLSSEPFPFRSKHLAEVGLSLPDLPVELIDGEMTSWYGSRAIQALRYLDHFIGEAALVGHGRQNNGH